MRKLIFITILCFFSHSLYSQSSSNKQYKLSVTLHNAPFSSLALLDYRDSHNVIIEGNSIGQFKWEFTISDSLVANSENMMLIVPNKDTVANAYHQISFIRDFKDKKTSLVNIGIQDETNYIEATYQRQTLFENQNVADFLGVTDSVIHGNLISNDFNLSLKNDSADIKIRSINPFYSWFYGDNVEQRASYSDYLSSYIELAKTYPDSRYLITNLARNLNKYKSHQDVNNIYQNFSKKNRDSKWGKKIELFLSDKLENISFMNLVSKRTETVLQDSSAYNLLIFSASWCIPCIEEIPLLKKLHHTLKKDIRFTFISMDNEKGAKAFQDILIKNDIPWRTLYAYKDIDRVSAFFSIKSIPHTLLIYPDGHMEVMDVRKEEIQKKLSSLTL